MTYCYTLLFAILLICKKPLVPYMWLACSIICSYFRISYGTTATDSIPTLTFNRILCLCIQNEPIEMKLCLEVNSNSHNSMISSTGLHAAHKIQYHETKHKQDTV